MDPPSHINAQRYINPFRHLQSTGPESRRRFRSSESPYLADHSQHERQQTRRQREYSRRGQLLKHERDKRTVIVEPLAGDFRTEVLHNVFLKVGPVRKAQIARDRTGRSDRQVRKKS